MKAVSEELAVLGGLFHDANAAYVARTEQTLQEVRERINALAAEGDPSAAKLRDLREMLTVLRHVSVKPEKGRRKDIRRIEGLIADLKSLVDSW